MINSQELNNKIQIEKDSEIEKLKGELKSLNKCLIEKDENHKKK